MAVDTLPGEVSPVGVVRLLDADPDLGEALGPDALAAARQSTVAPVVEVAPGPWDAPPAPPGRGSALGLLVVEGLLLRTVRAQRSSSELVGSGDIIRPWDDTCAETFIPCEVAWRVLQPTRLALLDRRFAQAIAAWPELLSAVTERALRSSRSQSLLATITSEPRVESRLLAFFTYAAERWGRVARNGILIDLPLSHERLGELVGAQRPTVTTALGTLASQGLLRRRDRTTWVLSRGVGT